MEDPPQAEDNENFVCQNLNFQLNQTWQGDSNQSRQRVKRENRKNRAKSKSVEIINQTNFYK